ncbi:hypothetical protein [Pelomonas cellulosilytica]|uniref:PEP-CTERM protein-sorting domain-containing protein n=1 Tax=Pelomonas cellulosilytica TaxID=2906762 RepID=A0ABS8XXX7_9BURK|nr:hypothetical protein [Pelomonas sp. P8]MCE4554175.1 hypothetical protein [Pelomonas sp. P8]
MKAVLLAALAALSSSTFAGATREPHAASDGAAVVMADAGRLGGGFGALNNRRWEPAEAPVDTDATGLPMDLDAGTLAIGLGALALALYRPVGRALRRQEQQRRAAALASTLGQAPRR